MSDHIKFIMHFPTETNKSIEKFVTDVVLKSSRYIFIWRVGKQQHAHCTHCKNEFPTENLKHKSKHICPKCKSLCKVQSAGISRQYLSDKGAFAWYEKSKTNPNAIIARIFTVHRSYSGDFRAIKNEFGCSHRYLFEQGNSAYYGYGTMHSSTYSAFDNHLDSYPKFHSLSNIKNAVKGTPFQYSTWEQYTKYKNHMYVSDMVEFFDLAARYPCIEYLTKMGLQWTIWAKLYREQTYGAIHWKGKTIQKVLRLNKLEINELRASQFAIRLKHLRQYQISKKEGLNQSLEDAYILTEVNAHYYKDYYEQTLRLAPAETILKYMKKQIRNGHYDSVTSLISDWHDYQGQCKTLGMDLKQERYLFPNNLNEAHKKATERIKLKVNKVINAKIVARLKDLEAFQFEHNGLFLRAAASTVELFEEGKTLGHCVGGYAEKHANGTSNIFFIRKKSQPDKPFFTLDLRIDKNGHGTVYKILQCEGKGRCKPTPTVKMFVNAFHRKKLEPLAQYKITVKNTNKMEVAV